LNPPLHTLTLADCGLDDVAGTALGRALADNSALRTLDLEGNELTGATAAALGDALLAQTLRQMQESDR
jgi:Ran GTPase-activating protein (RanGAP) involved in mRNA processing and transport